MTWTKEWPTEPGRYWFYGPRFTRDNPDFRHVEVSQGWGSILYRCEGNHMNSSYVGVWQRIVMPEPPEQV